MGVSHFRGWNPLGISDKQPYISTGSPHGSADRQLHIALRPSRGALMPVIDSLHHQTPPRVMTVGQIFNINEWIMYFGSYSSLHFINSVLSQAI